MSLTLDLPPAVEARLRERAAREGAAAEDIALNAVEHFLESAPDQRRPLIFKSLDGQEYSVEPLPRDLSEVTYHASAETLLETFKGAA